MEKQKKFKIVKKKHKESFQGIYRESPRNNLKNMEEGIMDLKDIITKVAGNKDLLEKLKTADISQAKDLLTKAGIKVDDSDVKKVKEALADGKLDMKEIKDIAGGLFK